MAQQYSPIPVTQPPSTSGVSRQQGRLTSKAKTYIALAILPVVGVVVLSQQDITPQQHISSIFNINIQVPLDTNQVATATQSENLVASSAPSPSVTLPASANVIASPKAQTVTAKSQVPVPVTSTATLFQALNLNDGQYEKVGTVSKLEGLGEYQFYQVKGEKGQKTYFIASVANPQEQIKIVATKSDASAPLQVTAECTKAFQKRVVTIRPPGAEAVTISLNLKQGKTSEVLGKEVDGLNKAYINLN
jgi:hypothetical protein